MKLYEYDDIKKANHALSSFKRNGVPITDVKLLTVGAKTVYYILTDPKHEPKPKKKNEQKKKTPTKKKKVQADKGTAGKKKEKENGAKKKNKGTTKA